MGGEMPISFASIDAYARRHKIVGDEFDAFLTIIHAIDHEWLAYRGEKIRQERELNKRP